MQLLPHLDTKEGIHENTNQHLLLLFYLCVFSHFSSKAIRCEVYKTIQQFCCFLQTAWQPFPLQESDLFLLRACLLLLCDMVMKESDWISLAFENYLWFLSVLTLSPTWFLQDLEQTFSRWVSSQQELLPFSPSQCTNPFDMETTYWCFYYYQSSYTLNRSLLFLAYSIFCSISHSYSLQSPRLKDFCIVALLQDHHVLRSVLSYYEIQLPSTFAISTMQDFIDQNPNGPGSSMNTSSNDHVGVEEEMNSIQQFLQKTPLFQFFDCNLLKTESLESIERLIDKQSRLYSSENGILCLCDHDCRFSMVCDVTKKD